MQGWPPLRGSRSEHHITQDARIHALLDEMRPVRRPLRVAVDDVIATKSDVNLRNDVISRNDVTLAPPLYHSIYPQKTLPSYNALMSSRQSLVPSPPRPTWATSPTRLSRSALSPSGMFFAMDDAVKAERHSDVMHNGIYEECTSSTSQDSRSSPADSCVENRSIGSRNTPRQASFMAAVGRHPLKEAPSVNGNSPPPLRRRPERKTEENGNYDPRAAREHRRTTIYGDEILAKCAKPETGRDQNHNDDSMSMRRARPKSYVLATSASLPETQEHTATLSQDETSRELSSMGSMSSIDHSARSAQAPHPPASHRIHKFISLFSQKDPRGRLRTKRSRTSLPEGRTPLPETTIPAKEVVRQSWMRHQEIPVGKSGKRSQWLDYWAILCDQTVFLCPQQPPATIEENTKEKVLQLPACLRVGLRSSVVDIAYDWLDSTRSRHVVRILTQARTEHLLELDSESEMLSWISSLQASSDGVPLQLPYSCSAVSLASSCSSDRNGHPATLATNQLIMHRYKAKSSQLQSPVATKRTTEHFAQPGTSKESSSGENGEPTTPKSGRKWKKSKAGKQGSGSSNSSLPPQSILGVRLADCASDHNVENVPLVVQICVGVVEVHGMDTVGIYRIPGNTAAVNALKETLSQGIDSFNMDTIDFSDSRWRDVNVVSSLLKMFLRKLPEPLLTDKLYPFFIDANRIASHQQRLHKLRNLLRKLPRHHYCTLRYLIQHLYAITRHCDVNKMETRNLALMFGPSIVRPSDDNMATMVTHMSDQCKIIETLIHYQQWMFDENSQPDDAVPDQHPSETGPTGAPTDPPQYGVGMPTGVSAATFNDMHNLIRKANEDQAAAMMSEGKGGKIKNMLRRNSRRDKSKGKLKIESTAPAATHPRIASTQASNPRMNSQSQQSSVDSAFLGHYQERDIDAEIMSRQTVSPLASTVEQSPSLESSLGSIPDSSRTDPGPSDADERRRRQQDMYSARRIFIAGSDATATDSRAVDALASHTLHLNIASSPALEVLSEETREKIRKMQRKQNWMERPKEPRTIDHLKACSPTRDQDAVSCTSDYSTTSSAPLTAPLAVACHDHQPISSDYASSDPSPCARNASASPRARPAALSLAETRCQQKIRLRTRAANRDPTRRHTLSDMDTLKEGRLDKLARWFGLRKSSPDISQEEPSDGLVTSSRPAPPAIVRTSPNELTPASGDELL